MILAGVLTFFCWFNIKHVISDTSESDNLMETIVLNSDLKLKLLQNSGNFKVNEKLIHDDFQEIYSLIEKSKNVNSENSFWFQLSELVKNNEKIFNNLLDSYTELSAIQNSLQISEKEFIGYCKKDEILLDELKYIRASNSENSDKVYLNLVNTSKNQANKTEELSNFYEKLILNYENFSRQQKLVNTISFDLINKIDELINFSRSNEISLVGEFDLIFRKVSISIIIFTIIAAIMAILVAEFIKISLTKGIKKGVGLAKAVSIGDLTIKIEDKYLNRKDEIGELANALNVMVIKLKDIVSNVIISTENISAASQEMSTNSQQVSQGASEQASAAEEVSSSIQEMSSNIQQNADNAIQTEKIAVKAANDIEEANKFVKNTADSMKEIFDKVSIISDIAFQTNILALNAAVEAARAGEHGKGFAVVASEIRKLAERSQEAATEINELSKSSVDFAVVSGELLNRLVPDIQLTARLVKEIASGSMEQNTGAEQINSAIQQLNQVIQQNAAAAEEMATSSEELAAHSQQMFDKVNYFKTGQIHNLKVMTRKSEKKLPKENISVNLSPKVSKSSNGFKLNLGMNDSIDNEYERF